MRILGIILVLLAIIGTGCMSIPEGVHLYETYSGCTSTGECPFGNHAANFYWAPTREIVVTPNASIRTRAHELCHAHQHQTIIEELGIEPTNSLHEWVQTSEGQKWQVVEATSPPTEYTLQKDNVIERFAEACGRYLTYGTLQWDFPGEEYRNTWFEERGF